MHSQCFQRLRHDDRAYLSSRVKKSQMHNLTLYISPQTASRKMGVSARHFPGYVCLLTFANWEGRLTLRLGALHVVMGPRVDH
jgi:hypothetical protein